jgi:methylase of polypeptide subunit release factors
LSLPTLHWTEQGEEKSALWQSEAGSAPPKRIAIADDRMTADAAYRLASEGTSLLWRGDFHNARQLLQALARRAEVKQRNKPATPAEAFNYHRQAQSHRARILNTILMPCDADYTVPLRRAPDIRQACLEAYGQAQGAFVVSLREIQGLIGAHEWRKKGVEIPALGARIHAHYGVFSPVRGEYLDLVAKAPLPSTESAIDVGTGTGVLAAILAKRGVKHVVATDMETRALQCARANIDALGYGERVEVVQADLFPPGHARLVVCNPPWVPARAYSPLEHAVYDPDSRMLRGFLSGLAEHLEDGGEGWLILSDLAEHLGLRTRAELTGWIDDGGLKVAGKIDTKPLHPKAMDRNDPLFAARNAELTSLFRIIKR